jgi:hypothetical protein
MQVATLRNSRKQEHRSKRRSRRGQGNGRSEGGAHRPLASILRSRLDDTLMERAIDVTEG